MHPVLLTFQVEELQEEWVEGEKIGWSESQKGTIHDLLSKNEEVIEWNVYSYSWKREAGCQNTTEITNLLFESK